MRLIDADKLKDETDTMTEWNGDVHQIIYKASLDDAPTISLDEGVKIIWSAQIDDIIAKINHMGATMMDNHFGEPESYVRLDKVIEILEEAKK